MKVKQCYILTDIAGVHAWCGGYFVPLAVVKGYRKAVPASTLSDDVRLYPTLRAAEGEVEKQKKAGCHLSAVPVGKAVKR